MKMVDQRWRALLLTVLFLAVACSGSDTATSAPGTASKAVPTQPRESVPTAAQKDFGRDSGSSTELPARAPAVTAAAPADKVILGPDLLPVSDSVLLRFDRPLSELRKVSSFGIFRDAQDRSVQWIEESEATIDGSWMRPSKWSRIHYEVPAAGSYNGWRFKFKGEDWTGVWRGDLALRLRNDGARPASFKIELKTSAGKSKVYSRIVQLDEAAIGEIRRCGFADVRIPFRGWIEDVAVLRSVDELALVFEHDRVTRKTADLYVHSIRVVLPREPAPLDAEPLVERLADSAFRWFVANRHPRSGLVLDRSPNREFVRDRPTTSSIAAVGYYLTMLPEAVRTGEIKRADAVQQAEETLSFVLSRVPHHDGLLPHFLHWETGEPLPNSEFSSLDSAIFLNGCCVASEAFGGKVRDLSDHLIDRVNWRALVIRHAKSGKEMLSLGWSPKNGMLGPMEVRSTEMAMPYILAIGSRTRPVDPTLWYQTQVHRAEVYGHKLLNPTHGLFTSYYGLGWVDLRGLVDRDGVDWEGNARSAALANRDFCRHAGRNAATYEIQLGGWWGISAGDSPRGYVAPGLVEADPEGTVWPTTAIAAWPWVRNELTKDLGSWRSCQLWPVVCGPYGLAPFNIEAQWVGTDLIAIDLGSFYVNYANHRAGTARRLWMKHPVAMAALRKLGFQSQN